MRISRQTLFICVLAVFQASSAYAVVSVSHTNDAVGTVPVGGTFSVDITADYDGSPVLTGIFTSAMWDPTQIMLTGSTTAPFAIFTGGTGFLSKLSDPTVFPGDPAGSLRTVQFGASPGQSGSAGPSTLITTLTFEVLATGDGTAEVDAVLLVGDLFTGVLGAELMPPDAILTGTVITVPEPTSLALSGSALLAVGLVASRRRLGKSLRQ